MFHMGLVRGKRLATPVRSSNSFHSAESPQKTIAPHLAFNPRGSLEHKRFVYLVHGACSLSFLASLQPDPSCSIITLPADIRHPWYCKEKVVKRMPSLEQTI